MNKFKLKLGKDALFLSILTLITVIVWMVMDIYRQLNKTQIPKVLKNQTKPLDPEISAEVFESIEKRFIFSEGEIDNLPNAIPNVIEETEESSPEKTNTEELTGEEIDTGENATESAILE